jgi:2-keto-4-pentenoate hydratase/2-oxohepta-3-ene-1,7-dioic acid hydratase in catechol pathway
MKIATAMRGGQLCAAIVEDDETLRLLPAELGDLGRIIETGVDLAEMGERAVRADGETRLVAPIPRPRRNIFCVGKNYHEHAKEFARSGFDRSSSGGSDVPTAPIIFTKVPECVIGTGEPVQIDEKASQAVDYEGELAVIIGRKGRAISREDALAHVWGYTIVNDVTARDLQKRLQQWHVGKSQDTFCPMGPWAVTADEIDLANTRLRTWINGELRQDANTRDLIFDVPTIIETISAGLTLYPGDIIATGTPVGVGIGFEPPRFLKPGDSMVIQIDGIGRLQNSVARYGQG